MQNPPQTTPPNRVRKAKLNIHSDNTGTQEVNIEKFVSLLDEGEKGYVSQEDFLNLYDVLDFVEVRNKKDRREADSQGAR